MSTKIYSARWVIPVEGPPFPDGEVVVQDGQIIDVRSQKGHVADRQDFGDAVLMPGLVNAHTHIEYTALRGFLEDVPFFPWIRALTALKPRLNRDDWLWSGRLAALELIAGGVTTIGDNTDAGISAQVAHEAGLRAIIYQEIFGIDALEPVESQIGQLDQKIRSNGMYKSNRLALGVSPHAPYTVRPELFSALAEYVDRLGLNTSIHVAETLGEMELIRDGAGPFAEMFARRGIEWNVPRSSSTEYVYAMKALNSRSVAVHCVHQSAEDIELIARSGSSIVHCPKSNGKLGAGVAPLTDWLARGDIRIGLGTDSAVSNNGLDMFEEMRHAVTMQRAVRNEVACITADQVLRMATLGGAEAMGISDRTGSLTVGKRADLIAVDLSGPHSIPVSGPIAAAVYSARASDVLMTVCDGEVLFDRGGWKTLEPGLISRQAQAVRANVSAG